jgi:subtilisin family serine protease
MLKVLIRFSPNLSSIRELGFIPSSVVDDIAAGSLPDDRLEALRLHKDVVAIELSRPLKEHMDVSATAIRLSDPTTDLRTIPALGRGAIIGIIDSSFDLTHPCFQTIDCKSRIIAAWDQANVVQAPGPPPDLFDYGVLYTRDMLDKSILNNEPPVIIKNEENSRGHGTQVASVASASGDLKGVAPEAELIMVAYKNDLPVGGSAFVVDALRFMIDYAQRDKKPIVINLSQGDHFGAHDGSSLLERAIDGFVRSGKVLIVVSAGNERNGPANHHAVGQLMPNQDFVLPFKLNQDHLPASDEIHIWYKAEDQFDLKIMTPSGFISPLVPPDTLTRVTFPDRTNVLISSELKSPINDDNRILITFAASDRWDTSAEWKLILSSRSVSNGEFHAWVDRPRSFSLISFVEHQSDHGTVTLPGTAHEVISVGSFVSRRLVGSGDEHAKGNIELGSAFGPTRDGRTKPDIVAPGALVFTPGTRPFVCDTCYALRRGTSFAAPHVTGVIALMWAKWPDLPAEEIRSALFETAIQDQFTGATPNNTCGHGKLNAEGVYKRLSESRQLQQNSRPTLERSREMDNKRQVFEFNLDPKQNKAGQLASMQVTITTDGDSVSITGISNGEKYVGELILKKKEKSDKAEGDQCWVCPKDRACAWVQPCPF